MNKSYVSMEQKVCAICDKLYDSGAILLDRTLNNSMEMKTPTGYGLCEEHNKEGHITLIEIDASKSGPKKSLWRTGRTCQIKEEAFDKIFNTRDTLIGENVGFAEIEVFDKLVLLSQSTDDKPARKRK